MRFRFRIPLLVLATSAIPTGALAAEPVRTPSEWVEHFSRSWDEKAWLPAQGVGRASQYIRPGDDAGWRARMLSLQGLVAAGRESIAPLRQTLRDGGTPERILAAQALGYLGEAAVQGALMDAAKRDAEPAVRLYAIDSLGMLGAGSLDRDLAALEMSESNRDVKKHIAYALERKGKPIDPRIAESLVRWDNRQLDAANVGQPAPDFELANLDGDVVRLSGFRDKKAVVLVFVYGDT